MKRRVKGALERPLTFENNQQDHFDLEGKSQPKHLQHLPHVLFNRVF